MDVTPVCVRNVMDTDGRRLLLFCLHNLGAAVAGRGAQSCAVRFVGVISARVASEARGE